jgi:uncharacterized membrane protein YeaQ/YmgE (transglycosylase-associated protein family)
MAVGMIGAVSGGYLFEAIAPSQVGAVIAAAVSAIVLLALLQLVRSA